VDQAVRRLVAEKTRPDVVLRWLLAQPVRVADAAWPPPGAPWVDLVDVPVMVDSQERPLSLQALARQSVVRRRCYYVPHGTQGQPADPTLRLPQLTAVQCTWMQRLFGDLVDYAGALAEQVAERQGRGRPRIDSLQIKVPVLGRRAVAEGGELGISADGSRGVHLVAGGTLFDTRPLFGELPVVGVVRCQEPAETLPDASLLAALDGLVEELAGQHSLLFLDWCHYRLEWLRAVGAAATGPAAAPLLSTTSGNHVSLAYLLGIVQRGGTVFHGGAVPGSVSVAVDAQKLEFLRLLLGPGLQAVSATSLPALRIDRVQIGPKSSWQNWWRRIWQACLAPWHRPLSDAEQQAAQAILEAVQSRLRDLPHHVEHGVDNAFVSRVELTTSGPLWQADLARQYIGLNSRHGVLRPMLGGPPPEGAILALAAAFYGTVRALRPDLSDTQEALFLEDLAGY
jgi:hypothetical protein